MKSGMTHLKKKMSEEGRENFFEFREARNVVFDEPAAPTVESCDLDDPCWTVVSFDRIEAGGLTHTQATKLINELYLNNITGLCLITDAAALRTR